MAGYVDGFVLPVPKKNVAKYRGIARMMDPSAMPFDGKRMIYGGFKVSVDL